MDNTVLVAIISGVCVAVPSVITTLIANNKNQAVTNTKVEQNQKFVEYQISELRKEVEKHNSVVERMALQEQQTKSLWKQIDSLKEAINEEHEKHL